MALYRELKEVNAMSITHEDIRRRADGVLSELSQKYPAIPARNADTEMIRELDIGPDKPDGNKKWIGYAKFRLTHLPENHVDAAMLYADICATLRTAKILTYDEIERGEFVQS